MEVYGKRYKGRELYLKTGLFMRAAFNDDTEPAEKNMPQTITGISGAYSDSLLFDKSKMATFERYFLTDKTTHTEDKGYYYKPRNDEKVCDMILDAFGVTGTHRHIINGHVPVKTGKGESPIKANGKLMVIDGGFAKAYHHTTGIAGYTLVYHSVDSSSCKARTILFY